MYPSAPKKLGELGGSHSVVMHAFDGASAPAAVLSMLSKIDFSSHLLTYVSPPQIPLPILPVRSYPLVASGRCQYAGRAVSNGGYGSNIATKPSADGSYSSSITVGEVNGDGAGAAPVCEGGNGNCGTSLDNPTGQYCGTGIDHANSEYSPAVSVAAVPPLLHPTFFFSIPPSAARSGSAMQNLIRRLPLERLLLETGALAVRREGLFWRN
jgi:hypothetical protein